MNFKKWRPSASIDTLQKRAQLMLVVRDFFAKRGYLEVETPVMAHFGVTDLYLTNINAKFRGKTYYLQTSPEYHMKRLLAAGSGPIFQLARVFRDDELGRWHNPEFTLLEWYKLDVDHYCLMQEVDAFLQTILNCGAVIKKSYQEIFREICDIDPFCASTEDLQRALQNFEISYSVREHEDNDIYLFLLMTHIIEPAMAKYNTPVAIYNFPPSQASLARVNDGVAERFEVYYCGVELANGFHELTDANEQHVRFQQDIATKKALDLPFSEADGYLLEALRAGLPSCSGVALGIDRLCALFLQKSSIAETLAFEFGRA